MALAFDSCGHSIMVDICRVTQSCRRRLAVWPSPSEGVCRVTQCCREHLGVQPSPSEGVYCVTQCCRGRLGVQPSPSEGVCHAGRTGSTREVGARHKSLGCTRGAENSPGRRNTEDSCLDFIEVRNSPGTNTDSCLRFIF